MKKEAAVFGIIIFFITIGYCFPVNKTADDQAIYDYNDFVNIIESKDGMALVTGQNRDGKHFEINLDYLKMDVILRNAYLMDLTEDSQPELCLELNIWNSASSDFKTIVICDMEKETILFPTQDKVFIYDGYIDKVKKGKDTQHIIRYTNYTKIIDAEGFSAPIANEESVVEWNGNSFITSEYQSKLLIETGEYLAFYKKYKINEIPSFRLVILDPFALQTYQEIELMLDETIITEKIKGDELVWKKSSETFDLYIEGHGELDWDHMLKEFK